MTDMELAWLVGLFEGEGCIGLSRLGRPSLIISMTDEDVIRRACSVAGVGNVRKRPTPTKSGKFMWTWLVGRCDEAAALLERMLPLLGERRAARAREALVAYAESTVPKRLRTHCPQGHSYSGDNLRIDNSRATPRRLCKACARERRRMPLTVAAHSSGVFTLA